MSLYVPPWLQERMGHRERQIAEAPDAKVMQCLPEWAELEEIRLPPGQQYIVSKSLNAWFQIDARSQTIIN